MSSPVTRPSRRKLSKAPVRSVPENAVEPFFDPGHLSHHNSRSIDVKSPFRDDNRFNGEDSENEHTSDGEHDSRYSFDPSTDGQALDTGSHRGRLSREQTHKWERLLERSTDGKKTPPVLSPGIKPPQQAEDLVPSKLKKEELVTLVKDLQLQLRQLKNIQGHPLTSRSQRKSPAEIVDDTKALRESVSTWADRYFRHESILSKDTGKRLDTLKVIVDEPEVYIKDSFLRTRLIQARLWDLLQHHIFDDDRKGERKYYGHIWTGGRAKRTWLKDAVTKENEQVDRDMRPLDDVLRPKANADGLAWKAYLEWRSSTYNLLVPPDRKTMIDEAELAEQNRIVSDRPAQFEIRRPWLKLSAGSFLFQYFGMQFDPETMSDWAPLYRSGAPLVAINTAPALFKSHDWSESVGQEEEVCLLKAQVCCSIPPRE
ncbi:hypothetical protein BLS_000525 [Venturia inaequalis]|uniref:Uncharacterized protein n=1 Tax=Venturia inaequalis TaxID=5025 RepID=A0A8H3VAD3_VENIN|nr:hypothetical protein BLS_000525 [Venturia inaequalis]